MAHHTRTADPATRVAPRPAEQASSRLPLLVLLAGVFLIVLDFFVVNVALPSVQRDLGASDTALEWVVAGYGLAYGGLLLAAARLGDRWGRRRLFGAGTALFVVTSAACGAAQTTEALVGARVVQGVAAAMLGPMVLALIGDLYSGPARLRAIGAYSTAMGLAAVSGQLVGGLLIQLDVLGLGWRSIFLVNVPVGVAILALLRRHVPESRSASPAPVDLLELGLATAVLVAVLLPLVEGPGLGWPAWTWASLGTMVLLSVPLVARSRTLHRRGSEPLLRAVLWSTTAVRLGLVRQVVLFVGMASYFLVLALYLQGDRGLGALGSGAVFTFVAVPYLLGTGRASRLASRWGRWTVSVSALVFLLGHALTWLAVVDAGPGASVLWVAPGLAVAGFGMGVCLTSQIGGVMALATPADAGVVSGTLSATQQVGNCIGVALAGAVYFGTAEPSAGTAFAHSLWFLMAALAVLAGLATTRPRTGAAGAVA
jgi:MFS family permease